MAVRKRLIIWLIKAYIQRWGKSIVFFFLAGCIIFFLLYNVAGNILPKGVNRQKEVVGVVGDFYLSKLPPEIISHISKGLTTTALDGSVKPGIAKSWKIGNGGKTYTFFLDPNAYFSDGKKVTSKDIKYDFSDISTSRPNTSTIILTLKEVYSPFLAKTMSNTPIFKDGSIGVGEYIVKDIKLNGGFIRSLDLESIKQHDKT